ncbi:hypothetical protein CLU79DRAFT_152959 [Phycomyces nitens]|nr:hypothetical protein CLU79DRAFT_152959 [Phycomyces nitens]
MLLSDLPQEVIEKIADPLSLKDKISCSLVCKSWKKAFQDFLYSDITIKSQKTLQGIINPTQHSRRKHHEIGHLVQNLCIGQYAYTTDDGLYALQNTFPNIKYLYLTTDSINWKKFGIMADWHLWRSLTELQIHTTGSYLPNKENSLVKVILGLPLLRRLEVSYLNNYKSTLSFSVKDLETIHSHLKHLKHMKLNTILSPLCDTDFECIANASPATTIKSLSLASQETDYRWLCYFSRKYPNIHTLVSVSYIFPNIKGQRRNTRALFQQVPVSFQHLENLNLHYLHKVDEGELFFKDKTNFHDTPLKHIRINVLLPYYVYHAGNLCDVPKNIAEIFLEKCSNTIRSFHLNCLGMYTTPINLMEMKNSLFNLVELDIATPTSAEIDTLLRIAPRLKSLSLGHAQIKVKDELYNSERFGLQSIKIKASTTTSDVLRFLSFHCRDLKEVDLTESSVYGNFTTPGCQLIDMTYSRLEKFYINTTEFIIKDNKQCPDNLDITLITRPVDDLPPKQDYDPNILPADIGRISDKNHDDWFYLPLESNLTDRISKEQASFITKFVSNYEENKKITLEKALDTKREEPSEAWEDCCVFGYTKLKLGYVPKYYCDIY